MTEETTLIPVQNLDVSVVFSDTGLDEILSEIERRVKAHVPDVTTDQGRKDIASLAYKVARSKTVIDNLGKDVIADWKKKTDNINGYRKRARDFLDRLKDDARKPLTDYEAEQERIEAEEDRKHRERVENRVAELQAIGVAMAFFDVATMTDEAYSEFYAFKKSEYEKEQARIAAEDADRKEKEEAEAMARAEEDARLKKERAELDKVRKEQEAERAKLKAEQDKLEQEKREAEHQKQLEIAKKEAAERAAQEERDRIEREAKEGAAKEERAEKERLRKAAMAPDKEKLIAWVNNIRAVVDPELNSDEAKEIWRIGVEYIDLTLQGVEKETEGL